MADREEPGGLPALPLDPVSLRMVERAREYAESSRARNTRRAYESDWRDFEAWARRTHPDAPTLPAHPALVALYLVHLAEETTLTTATIKRRASGIGYRHVRSEHASPTGHAHVKDVLEGIIRERQDADHARATVKGDLLREMIEKAGPPVSLLELRDRAMILLNFGNGRRRSEIAALDLDDLEFREQGVFIRIKRSKTDQRGIGARTWLPRLQTVELCGFRALQDWLNAADIRVGPVFRTFSIHGKLKEHRVDGRDVTLALKRLAEKAGMSPDVVAKIASHSLRRGYITSADEAGVRTTDIMRNTLHRDRRTLDKYIRRELTEDSPLLDIFSQKK